MYGEIDGGAFSWDAAKALMCIIQFLCIIGIFIVVLMMHTSKKAQFQNLPDYGIGQRRDVIAALPSYEEESMQQKVDRWSGPAKASQLTGSRDFPVFFQDNSIEATRKKDGAVEATREGFEGGKSDDDLTQALSGR